MKVSARVRRRFLGLALGGFLVIPAAWAESKDLSRRFGFGVSRVGFGPASLSVDWQLTVASSFEFDLGLDTSSSNNTLLLGASYARNLFIEENMSFFLFLGGGLLSQQISGSNSSGYYVETGVGSRFFFTGIPNLGFSVRGGFNLASQGGIHVRTMLFGGVHYYF